MHSLYMLFTPLKLTKLLLLHIRFPFFKGAYMMFIVADPYIGCPPLGVFKLLSEIPHTNVFLVTLINPKMELYGDFSRRWSEFW